MADYNKAQQMNEKIKALLLERGVKVQENRSSKQLEQDLLHSCRNIKIKLSSSSAKFLEKK